MSNLLLWLFKKGTCDHAERPWANRSCRTLLKSDVSNLIFFMSKLLSLTKKDWFAISKKFIFRMLLTVFHSSPLFYPKANRSHCSLQKSDHHPLQKSNVANLLFFMSECFFSLSLTNDEQFAQKTDEQIPNPGFWTKIEEIWHFPNCTQGKQHANA